MDVAHCEVLVMRITQGDDAARQQLVAHLWPFWLRTIATHRSMGSLRSSEDHVHDVAAALASKVAGPTSDALAQYRIWRSTNAGKDFGDWMRIVLANAIRDYVRSQLGSKRLGKDELSPKRLLNEFTQSGVLDEVGTRPPFTNAQAAKELLDFARSELPPLRLRVLELWLTGQSFEEIALEAGISSEQVRKEQRAAVAVLRRRFLESTLTRLPV